MIRKIILLSCIIGLYACGGPSGNTDQENQENYEETESETPVLPTPDKITEAPYDPVKVNLLCKKWAMSLVYSIDSAGKEHKIAEDGGVSYEFKKDRTFTSGGKGVCLGSTGSLV